MKKTTNYALNQWEAEDRVTREAFNADNAAVDAALKAVADAASPTLLKTVTLEEDHAGLWLIDISQIDFSQWRRVRFVLDLVGSGLWDPSVWKDGYRLDSHNFQNAANGRYTVVLMADYAPDAAIYGYVFGGYRPEWISMRNATYAGINQFGVYYGSAGSGQLKLSAGTTFAVYGEK